jgi:hypothetical protein
MTTTTAERPRQRTLSQAQDRIDELEAAGDPQALKAEISRLNSVLISRDAEIRTLKAAGSSQQGASPVSSQSAATKPISEMELSELITACDTAAAVGNKLEANRFYKEYARRRANHS